MNKNEEKINWHLQAKIALMLTLSASALPAMAADKSLGFSTAIAVNKERPCELKITPTMTSSSLIYDKNGTGSARLKMTEGDNIKINIDAIGENECTIGKLEVGMRSVNIVNGTSALILKNGKGYFPFDYALGYSEFQYSSGAWKNASPHISRDDKNDIWGRVNRVFSIADQRGKIYHDEFWHRHKGGILWQSDGEAYVDENYTAFWLSPSYAFGPIVIDSSSVQKIRISIIPVYSIYPYNTSTEKRDDSVIDAGDALENTAVFTFTSV
ncbi:hypothetical protein [Pectobacterium zantedeschiae]|uniref:hypothetical protein n=1 Tax=Pectobacterium zantedeschiae TaxID=2034769 RepID=UPI00101E021A|nr:hypothetical protein [Pectobacterium zantedeschiae]RYC43364.1 hypothetical protein DEH81_12670 [Pectobacterium zantedeschiae]